MLYHPRWQRFTISWYTDFRTMLLICQLHIHQLRIPRQIPKQDLLMPLEWLSNMSSSTKTLSLSKLQKSLMKNIWMTFKPPTEQAPRLSFSYSSMIAIVSTSQEDIPIFTFQTDGYPIYPAKLNGHFLWDTSEAHMCDPGCPCLDDYLVQQRRKKKKKLAFANAPCHTYPPHLPDETYFQRPLLVCNKGLKYLQKTQAFLANLKQVYPLVHLWFLLV